MSHHNVVHKIHHLVTCTRSQKRNFCCIVTYVLTLGVFCLCFVFFFRHELVLVMNAVGNNISNAVYEANTNGHTKPLHSASRYANVCMVLTRMLLVYPLINLFISGRCTVFTAVVFCLFVCLFVSRITQ